MYNSRATPSALLVPPPQLPSLRPVLSRIGPPPPPPRLRILQHLSLLLLPFLTRLAHQGDEKGRTVELLRQRRSRPGERILAPQFPDLLDLRFVEVVGLLVRFAHRRRQGLVLLFVGVGVAEGLGQELTARIAGGEEFGGRVVDGGSGRGRVEDDVVLGWGGAGREGREGWVWFYPEAFRGAAGGGFMAAARGWDRGEE